MDSLSYKTQNVNKTTAVKNWVLVDAKDKVLGRVSSEVAKILRGKNKRQGTQPRKGMLRAEHNT